MATNQINVGDTVRILAFAGDQYNEFGRVQSKTEDGRYWVTNMNMPWQGTVSAFFDNDELEVVQ